MNTLLEKSLLYKIQTNQDQDAFAQLYDAYIEKIYRFVSFKVGSRADAEDVTSDVFLRTWRYLIDSDQSQIVQSFSGLVYRIARNRIVDHYREKAKENERIVSSEYQVVSDNASQVITLETKQDVDYLLIQIRKMKQEYQDILFMRYVDDISEAAHEKRPI